MHKQLKTHAPDLTNICAMPKNLGQAIGYQGPADLLGVWWERAGDELAWFDGITTMVGANMWPYLNFLEHKLAWMLVTAPSLIIDNPIHIGASDQEATWWMIWDLKNEDIFTAPRNQAEALIRAAAGKFKVVSLLQTPSFSHGFKPGDSGKMIVDDRIKVELVSNPGTHQPLYASANFMLCSCGGGWIYDRDKYECTKHADCAGEGFVYPHL